MQPNERRNYIRSRVFDLVNSQGTVQKLDVGGTPKGSGNGFMTIFLGTLIFLMSGATIFAVVNRPIRSAPETVVVQRPVEVQQPPVVIQPNMSGYDARLSAIEKKVDVIANRVWLLGIAHNENANVSNATDAALHNGHKSNFITFDEQWRINRVPSTMTLSEAQKQDLQRNLVK